MSPPEDKSPPETEVKPSRPRSFHAHYILDGPLKWEDTSPRSRRSLPEHSLTLYMSPLWRSPVKLEVLRFVAKALVENRFDWFSLDGDRWRVD